MRRVCRSLYRFQRAMMCAVCVMAGYYLHAALHAVGVAPRLGDSVIVVTYIFVAGIWMYLIHRDGKREFEELRELLERTAREIEEERRRWSEP